MNCTDPAAAAWRILSLLDGLHLQEVAHGDSVTGHQVTKWSRHGAEIELGLDPGTLTNSSQGNPWRGPSSRTRYSMPHRYWRLQHQEPR